MEGGSLDVIAEALLLLLVWGFRVWALGLGVLGVEGLLDSRIVKGLGLRAYRGKFHQCRNLI